MKKEMVLFVSLIMVALLWGCGQQESTPTPTTTLPPVVYNFNAAAAEGDLLTYAVDVANHTYAYNNITYGVSGSGTYTVNTDGTISLDNGGTGMLLTAEVMAAGIPGTDPDPDTIVVGVPTLSTSYGASADGTYNFINSYGDYGTFEVDTAAKTVAYYDISNATYGTGTYTDEGTGVIKYTDLGGTNNVMLLPGKVVVMDQPDGMTVGVAATTEYGADVGGTYRWVDSEGSHGTFTIHIPAGVASIGVGDTATFEGTSSYAGGVSFTGEATVLSNGSFLVWQYNPTSMSSKDAIILPGKVLAFNNRGEDNYLGFGVQF